MEKIRIFNYHYEPTVSFNLSNVLLSLLTRYSKSRPKKNLFRSIHLEGPCLLGAVVTVSTF